jgi:hypothetical protein
LIKSTVRLTVGSKDVELDDDDDPVDAAATPPPEATASTAPAATSFEPLNRNRIHALRASALDW